MLISLVEFVLNFFLSGEVNKFMNVLAAMSSIRLLKLARFHTATKEVLELPIKSLKSIGPFTVLVILFVFIWTLMGIELFSYQILFDENHDIITDVQNAKKML